MRYLPILTTALALSLASTTPAHARGLLDWLRGNNNNNNSAPRRAAPATNDTEAESTNFVAGGYEWKVTNEWTPALEKKFSEFVQIMGESGCKTLNKCLTSASANPFYINQTPTNNMYPADCADFPHALRMYFSWQEGLPFDYVTNPQEADPEQETNHDIRYTKFGNKPGGKKKFVMGKKYNFLNELLTMRDSVSTATYRMHYDYQSDFYPTVLDRKNIRPGSVAYDPAGHAAIIYKVGADGVIKMMDAHPDNSVTRITYDQKFTRSRPAHGAGIRNWRPELNTQPAEDLPGFSTVQFNKKFLLGDESVSYYDYLRGQLSGGSLNFHPVTELRNMMSELCSNVHDREIAVGNAIAASIHEKSHPDKLPRNIYGTDGEWEEYSSPSRDARLKVGFIQIRTEIERFVKMYKDGNSRITYEPVASKYSTNCRNDRNCMLVASLMEAYEDVVMNEPSCIFRYKKSDGSVKKLSYSDITKRLFKLSFDPYHCVELRWGASGDELSSCGDGSSKMKWYKNEQGLRNQTERTYDARMDTDVNDTANQGKAEAADIDLWGYLSKQLP